MEQQTTVTLDEPSAQRLERLAARWQVSQAEAVRRSIEEAEKMADVARPNPIELLRQLHARGAGLEREKAEAYLAEVYEDRRQWRNK